MDRILEIILEGLIFLRNYALFPKDGETFSLLRILSLFLAFSISGAVTVFLSQGVVLKYFGPDAKKLSAYLVAGFSGAILAVCSCSVLPMFESIRKKGAGLGPAIAFLFSGPAINLLAITLTFSTLGLRLGFSRVFSALILAWTIGIIMHLIYGKKETKSTGALLQAAPSMTDMTIKARVIFFVTLLLMLLFGVYVPLFTGLLAIVLIIEIKLFMSKDDFFMWLTATWDLTKKIIPLFVVGIFLAGVVQAVVPASAIMLYVGQSNLFSHLVASVFGAFMYFATITEIPIVASLMNLGMHPGPALTLLLAGPTLSLPNMIVLSRVLGLKKGLTYFSLVILTAALMGGLIAFIL
jgi:uncharacterized membrane protein YraQ (UPF0718 family)